MTAGVRGGGAQPGRHMDVGGVTATQPHLTPKVAGYVESPTIPDSED